jgi:hypothetical protein
VSVHGVAAHAAGAQTETAACDGPGAVTRSLLGYLALAGPLYVVTSLLQALTRQGFDLRRHEWSLLAVGHLGWIQVTNLVLTGVMTIIGAVGVRRALGRAAVSGTWAPRLLAGYGVGLLAAGVFTADPADGFPPGTPAGRPAHSSWHGQLHLLSGSIGFVCLVATCFVMARGFTRRGLRGEASVSRAVGGIFVVAFAGIASGAANTAVNLGFTAAVIISYGWLTAVAVHLYRRVGTRVSAGPATAGAR